MSTPTPTEMVIQPTRGFAGFGGRDIWAYRDLLWILVWRDFATRYKQTVLGPLWFAIQPLLTTAVFVMVFWKFAKLPTAGTSPMLFYLAGLLGWNYFAQTFQSTSTTLLHNAGLFGKVYFPRLVMPLSAAISNLVAFAVQFISFLLIWALHGLIAAGAPPLSAKIIWLPLIVLHIAAFGLGTGLWLAALTTRYRDFAVISAFLIQIWLYATPVIYPFAQVPERWQLIIALNPMAMPVEAMRQVLLNAGLVNPGYYVLSVALTLVVLLSGLLFFQRIERTFVDQI